MKKILFVATVPEHFLYFHIPCFRMLRENGWEVHAVCAGSVEIPECDRRIELPISRSPADKTNREAYRQLKKLIDEEGYDVVHSHTPVGGALARLASRQARKNGTKVYYTAHGFHFCKGAPFANWLAFLPAERFFSRMTDELLTINNEDFGYANKLLKAKNVRFIHGVGCDLERFGRDTPEERNALRSDLGYGEDEKIIFYAAELNINKNQSFLIETVNILRKTKPKARLVLAGQDNLGGVYQRLAAELKVPVDFLGVRNDIPRLMKACDIYAASSLREGLPLNIMEAMATGLPVVAVANRGHCALIRDGETGYIVAPDAMKMAAEHMARLLEDEALYARFSAAAIEAVQPYSTDNVLKELAALYEISSTELV